MTVSRYYDVKRDARGKRYLEPFIEGSLLLGLPLVNYPHQLLRSLVGAFRGKTMQRRHPQNRGRFTQVRRKAPSGHAARCTGAARPDRGSSASLATHAHRACSLGDDPLRDGAIAPCTQGNVQRSHPVGQVTGKAGMAYGHPLVVLEPTRLAAEEGLAPAVGPLVYGRSPSRQGIVHGGVGAAGAFLAG